MKMMNDALEKIKRLEEEIELIKFNESIKQFTKDIQINNLDNSLFNATYFEYELASFDFKKQKRLVITFKLNNKDITIEADVPLLNYNDEFIRNKISEHLLGQISKSLTKLKPYNDEK